MSIFPPKERCTFPMPTIAISSPSSKVIESLDELGVYSMNQSFLLKKCRDAPELINQADDLYKFCLCQSHEGVEGWLLLLNALYDMSLLLRPSWVGFLICQPLFAVLLHVFYLATVVTGDGLWTFGCTLTTSLTCLLAPFAFALEIGGKSLLWTLGLTNPKMYLPSVLL